MTRELGKKTAKCVLLEGVLSIFLAALLLTFVISDISEYEFGVSQYVMVYLISVLMSTTLTTLLLFIITCIESLIIMIVDRKFNMRNLLFANYNFFGKNILLSSMLLLAVVHFDSELVKRVFVLVTYVTAIWLIASYYFNIIRVASVNKKAAKLLVSIMGVLIVVINFAAFL